ncbi:MAG: ABC transporter permease [Armatimonadota bacterium]|nr:ABC transporter permease [Armatimonadota bacterium]MDR7519481.1 ABC transporter permease [Armatimonadota bacterium]MDR7549054.1 ABC transporter permease [Armatimonadota bacterium]
MRRYLVRRLLLLVPVVFGILIVVFVLMRVVPGDPVRLMAGFDADESTVRMLRHELGLDRPLPIQFGYYVAQLVRGDLGISLRSRRPVKEEIRDRFRNTLILALSSTTLAVAVGAAIGVTAAYYHRSLVDYLSMATAVLGVSVPSYFLGILLILLFSVVLDWLPAGGIGGLRALVLPALTLAASSSSIIARMTRSSVLEALTAGYVRTARAKGLHERLVVGRHALPNALIPLVTILGLEFGFILGGAILVETVFSYPGVGWMMVEAIGTRDFPIVQGGVLVIALAFVLINLLVDVLYAVFDPRVSY